LGAFGTICPCPESELFSSIDFPATWFFYRLEQQEIELLRVRHGMMHLPGLFDAKLHF